LTWKLNALTGASDRNALRKVWQEEGKGEGKKKEKSLGIRAVGLKMENLGIRSDQKSRKKRAHSVCWATQKKGERGQAAIELHTP